MPEDKKVGWVEFSRTAHEHIAKSPRPELPIITQWKESLQQLKDKGRRVTINGSAWSIHNAIITDVSDHIVVLDILGYGTSVDMRHFVAYDAIHGLSFERPYMGDSE